MIWVLNLNSLTWSKANNISPYSSSYIKGNNLADSKALLLEGKSACSLKLFPGSKHTVKNSKVLTKRFSMGVNNRKSLFSIRKVKIDYEGPEIKVYVTAYNKDFTDTKKKSPVLLKGSGRWSGLEKGLIGNFFDIEIKNACTIGGIEVELIR